MRTINLMETLVLVLVSLLLSNCRNILPLEWENPAFRRLTTTTYRYELPRWSPDGTQIAYYVDDLPANRVIYVMQSNGREQIALTDRASNSGSPDWSPDGKRIVFSAGLLGSLQLFSMKPDGSDRVRLTHDLIQADFPKWSPDGKRIAFSAHPKAGDSPELFVMQADGSQIEQLTHSPLGEVDTFEWSPDGSSIIFAAANIDARRENSPYSETGPYLYIIDADGHNERQIFPGNPGFFYLTWSSDGQEILFSYLSKGKLADGFYLLQVNGTQGRLVLSEPSCEQPNWSRTGHQIVFVCGSFSYQGTMYAIDANVIGR